MAGPQVVGPAYPYLTIRIQTRGHDREAAALVDTGFTGDLAVPRSFFEPDVGLPDARSAWELADGTTIDAPLYVATVEIVGLPPIPAALIALGNEFILGRGIIDRFKVTFEHGERVIVEL
jgi:predicted aspartyl protease